MRRKSNLATFCLLRSQGRLQASKQRMKPPKLSNLKMEEKEKNFLDIKNG